MKNKTNKIFSIAITAIMLLFVLAAMPTMTVAAAVEGAKEAQSSLDIDNPTEVSSAEEEEQHIKEIIETHEKQLERLKQISAIPISAPVPPVPPAPTPTPHPIHVYVHESYYYDLGSDKLIKEHASSLSIDINLYDADVDTVTVNLQLPVGITPEYRYGNIPEGIYYNDVTGELSLTYDTCEMTDEGMYTTFDLPELELDPFATVPTPNVTPSYCAPFESKEVTLSLSPAVLKEEYDYGRVKLRVSNVNTTEITDTTPEADSEYDGDHSASAYWYYYDIFDELPEHVMDVYVENDIYEIYTSYECDVEKYTGTNVEILDVTTSPAVTVYTSSYTWIDSDVHFDLDPTNYTMMHGFLEGTAHTETGEVLSGAEVRLSGAGYDITKITDENGKYNAMLPPWVYSIFADYGYIAYDDKYESEYYDVFLSQDTTVVQNLTLYEVPTVKMKIDPIDNDLTDGAISYEVTVGNKGSKSTEVYLYGYDYLYDGSYYLYGQLEWAFNQSHFWLEPGEKKEIRADAEFIGTEPLDWGKYAFEIDTNPYCDEILGDYDIRGFCEVHCVFDVIVDADKEDYRIGETIYLGMSLTSYEGPYNIDLGIDGEYSDERWNYAKLTGLYYPADYTWTGGIPIAIPASKFVPPGDYELIIWIKDSATGQLLGEGSDGVRIEHGKIMEKITIESFE